QGGGRDRDAGDRGSRSARRGEAVRETRPGGALSDGATRDRRSPPRGGDRRRLRRVAGGDPSRAGAGGPDPGRSPQLPSLPAAHLPGGDRRALTRGGLLSAARDLQATPQRPGADGGG